MAIMHINFKILKRSEGKSSIYLAAYNNRERLKDERTGAIWNYTKKKDLYHSEIMLPYNAPDRFRDRVTLWNEIENIEKRKDAQLSRYFIVALPKELSPEENKKLLKTYLNKNFIKEGMIADFAIHEINSKNPHAHVMLTLRDVCAAGFLNKNREWNKPENVDLWRKKWAYEVNTALKNNNVITRISPLSDLKRKEEIIKQAEKFLNEGDELKAEQALMIAQKLENKGTKKRIPRQNYILKNKKHTRKKETVREKEENKKVSKLKSIFNSLMSKFNEMRNEKEIEQLNDKLKTLQKQKHTRENKFFNDTLTQLKKEKLEREEMEKQEAAKKFEIENKNDITKSAVNKKEKVVKNEKRKRRKTYI